MPSRNIIKRYRNGAVFHAYNRGVNGTEIFFDDFDRRRFIEIFAARLPAPDVGLVSFCLMPNHFHLALWQYLDRGVTRLMHSALTSYVRYFNARHQRYGRLFQNTFKASGPHDVDAARKIIAYVHLNPLDLRRGPGWEDYEFSSHSDFLTPESPAWLDRGAGEAIFGDRERYLSWMGKAERGRKKLTHDMSALWTPR